MSRNKLNIKINGKIMPGCISKVLSTCGKPNCACRASPPKLHGPFYRWTGMINGKQATRTINKEAALECEKRIKNYRKLQKNINEILVKALKTAPWTKK
jgi:hypothetical protein